MRIIAILVLTFFFINLQAQDKLERLNKMFEEKDTSSLLEFINEWARESDSLANSYYIENDTLRTVYELFNKMYCPTKWRKLGRSEFGKSIYKKTKYIIVQSQFEFWLCHDYDEEYGLNDSCDYYEIPNFYPDVKIKNKTTLFLTPDYDSVLNKFLGTEQYDVGHFGLTSVARAKGISEEKMDFLNIYLNIVHGHWGGWIIGSAPYIGDIEFDKEFKTADATFGILYEGGETKFKKFMGLWLKIKSKMTWIT